MGKKAKVTNPGDVPGIYEVEYEVEKLDGIIDSVPVEKILDQMGFPKNYMELVNV